MKVTPSQNKALYGLLRELVSARDGYGCLKCGKTERLQMSHIYPKGKHRRMEYDPENVKWLCVGCHLFWWHKSPIEAWEWLANVLPPDRIKRLRLRANTIDKTPFDFKLYKLFLEQEIKKLKPKAPVFEI